MKFGAVALLMSLYACAPSYKARLDVELGRTGHETTTVPAIAALEPRPWKIGQWAIYRTSDGGYQTIAESGEGSCGTWFDTMLVSNDGTISWGICLHEPKAGPTTRPIDWVTRVVIRDRWGTRPTTVAEIEQADAFAAVVAGLFPATWTDRAAQREVIDVPAGHFVDAIRADEPGGTRWTHSAVPFGSTVRFRTTNGQVFELAAFGETRDANPIDRASSYQGSRPPVDSFALGFEGGWLSGHGADGSHAISGPSLEVTRHIRPQLDASISEAFLSVDDSPNGLIPVTLGVHWYPLAVARPRFARFGVEGLFVRADAGYAELGARNEDRANGVVGNIGLGWLQQFRGWATVFEAGDRVMWLNQDAGVRHDLGFTISLRGER